MQLKELYKKGGFKVQTTEDPSLRLSRTPRALLAERDGLHTYVLYTDVDFSRFAISVENTANRALQGVRSIDLTGVVYVAGPMRGYEGQNFAAFDHAKELLVSLGYYVFSPADMDRQSGFDGSSSELPPCFLRDAMDRDCNAISKCTHIFLLPGWENSSGVRPEGVFGDFINLKFLTEHTPTSVPPVLDEVPSQAVCAVIGGRLIYRFHEWQHAQAAVNN